MTLREHRLGPRHFVPLFTPLGRSTCRMRNCNRKWTCTTGELPSHSCHSSALYRLTKSHVERRGCEDVSRRRSRCVEMHIVSFYLKRSVGSVGLPFAVQSRVARGPNALSAPIVRLQAAFHGCLTTSLTIKHKSALTLSLGS